MAIAMKELAIWSKFRVDDDVLVVGMLIATCSSVCGGIDGSLLLDASEKGLLEVKNKILVMYQPLAIDHYISQYNP